MSAHPSRPSAGVKALYGVGAVGDAIKTFSFGLFLFFFYTSVLGLSGTLVGIATAVGLVWDACIDPAIGWISDRAKARYSRQVFMFVGAILAGFTFAAVFGPVTGASSGALFVWLLLATLAARTASSIFRIPYCALGAELTRDYNERTSVTGVAAAFGLIGTLISGFLAFTLFFPDTPGAADAKFHAANYRNLGLVFGGLIALTGVASALGTKGFRPPDVPVDATKAPLRLVEDLSYTLHNRPFTILTAASSIFFLAAVVNATLCIHYLTYYARVEGNRAIALFQLAFVFGGIVGVPCWIRAARQVDKRTMFIVATLITSALMSAAYWAVGAGALIEPGQLAPLAGGNALAGFFASAVWVVPPSMIADVADYDESLRGVRREGALFGMYSFAHQGAASLAIALTGVLVDRYAGLVPGLAAQSAETSIRLGVLFGTMPSLLLLVAAALISFYPLTRRQLLAVHDSRNAPAALSDGLPQT